MLRCWLVTGKLANVLVFELQHRTLANDPSVGTNTVVNASIDALMAMVDNCDDLTSEQQVAIMDALLKVCNYVDVCFLSYLFLIYVLVQTCTSSCLMYQVF